MASMSNATNALQSVVSTSRLCIVAGKGGVGKTTIAAALATQHAVSAPNEKVLCISADRSHSLARLFSDEQGRDDGPTPANLQIEELDFAELMKAFQSLYGAKIQSTVEQGSYLTNADTRAFVDLSLPALGELMALMHIAELLQTSQFSRIVLDASPTGNMLRLLQLPSFLNQLSEVLSMLEERRAIVVSSLVHGRATNNRPESIATTLSERAHVLNEQLQDGSITTAVVVSLPEDLPVEQTEDLVHDLGQMQIDIRALVVNKTSRPRCEFCRARLQSEGEHILELVKRLPSLAAFTVPLVEEEPTNIAELTKLIESAVSVNEFVHYGESVQSYAPKISTDGSIPPGAIEGKRLIFLSGKGGVGKTTLIAALALASGEKQPTTRVLVASIDPAHALGNALKVKLSAEPVGLTNNVSAVEVDAQRLLQNFQEMYRSEAGSVISALLPHAGDSRRGFGSNLDSAITNSLLNLETPDLDEFLVFQRLLDLRKNFDVLYVDPPPSGHLLKFITLPEIAEEWITALLKVIREHQAIEQNQRTVGELLTLLKASREFRQELIDEGQTSFFAITTPQKLVLDASLAMAKALSERDIATQGFIINMQRPDNKACEFCHHIHERQAQAVQSMTDKLPAQILARVNQTSREIRGVTDLTALGEALYG